MSDEGLRSVELQDCKLTTIYRLVPIPRSRGAPVLTYSNVVWCGPIIILWSLGLNTLNTAIEISLTTTITLFLTSPVYRGLYWPAEKCHLVNQRSTHPSHHQEQLSTNRPQHNEVTLGLMSLAWICFCFVLSWIFWPQQMLHSAEQSSAEQSEHCPAKIPVLVATLFLPSKLLPTGTL